MERYWLVAASFCFLLSFGHTLFALRRGTFRPGRLNLLAMAAGFACQTVFLVLRGQAVQTCPITNLSEVLVFLGWSIVLVHLLVGAAYRFSLMGAFTAPLVLVLQLLAWLAPVETEATRSAHNPWIEFHAALSIIAYGAFALAGIAGVMYLVQERLLKSRKVSGLLLNLPPISDLGAVNRRLVFTGLVLLSIAFAAGAAAGFSITGAKTGISFVVWTLYGTLLVMERLHLVPAGRIAGASIAIFLLALVTLPLVSHLPPPR
jgi:ABC-type uncharacterized transport system permease subunit